MRPINDIMLDKAKEFFYSGVDEDERQEYDEWWEELEMIFSSIISDTRSLERQETLAKVREKIEKCEIVGMDRESEFAWISQDKWRELLKEISHNNSYRKDHCVLCGEDNYKDNCDDEGVHIHCKEHILKKKKEGSE